MNTLAAFLLAGSLATAGVASAQTPPPGKTAEAPSAGDYAAALMNLECETCEGKVQSLRGFSLATPSAGRPSAQAGRPTAARVQRGATGVRVASLAQSPRVSASDLRLTFRRGSAELTPEGQANARSFAQALNDPRLSTQAFLIVGHTDATGSPDRNQKLSQDRAEAVKQFLVSHGVDAGRLETKGLGSQQLAVPSDPGAAANRRVEVKRAS